MSRSTPTRRILVSLMTLCCLLAMSLSLTILTSPLTHAASMDTPVPLDGSFISAPPGSNLVGPHARNTPLTVTLVLPSGNAAQMNSLLANLYDPSSPQFHQWLPTGQFNALFAPSAAQIAPVTTFLQGAGLHLEASPSPFLLRASGTTVQMEQAFHTSINDHLSAQGQSFFQNDSAVQLPASLHPLVVAVSGLSNTARLHSNHISTPDAAKAVGKPIPQYGAGPGGSGLSPAQTSSLYDANGVYRLGNQGKGQGATLAVFELSGYTRADIGVYEHQFFGASENVPLVDINVDGGPLTPICPTGDTCNAGPDFSGDIEVNADIETQIAVAPKISQVLVYNAPNDFMGITTVNEYFKIANDNLASSISSSWGLCEQDAGLGQIEAESVAFMQMAAQGQSIFNSSGDTGAFDCLRGSGFTGRATEDPASQPFMTSVGGTSFGSFDPGANQNPAYPTGFETVWNVLNQCSANNLGACAATGAGGGGVSAFWAMPSFQHGPGVISSFSQKAPFCSLAATGQFCRQGPDISANADEFTPYAEFCTGDPSTNSACGTFSAGQTPPGWFGIGGTSLSSPVWSSIIALWDSVHKARLGVANVGLYQLFRSPQSYNTFFHDITGKNQTENNNGFFPVTPNYDMATGIGTPRISAIAMHNF